MPHHKHTLPDGERRGRKPLSARVVRRSVIEFDRLTNAFVDIALAQAEQAAQREHDQRLSGAKGKGTSDEAVA